MSYQTARPFSCCHLNQSWPVCLCCICYFWWRYMNMIELLHILLEWIGFLLPWICIVSLAWIQSFFLTFLWSSNISLFLVLSIAHNLAPVLSRSFVHWRRLVLYFYFYTQVVLGFGPLFFQCCFGLFFFRAGGGYFL